VLGTDYALARFRFTGRTGFLVFPRFDGAVVFCRTDNARRGGPPFGGSRR